MKIVNCLRNVDFFFFLFFFFFLLLLLLLHLLLLLPPPPLLLLILLLFLLLLHHHHHHPRRHHHHHHHLHHPDPDEFTVRLLKSNQQIPKKFTLLEFPPCWLDRIHLLGSSKHCHDMTSTVNNCQCNPRIYSLVIKHDNGSQPCSSTGRVVIMYSMIVVISLYTYIYI